MAADPAPPPCPQYDAFGIDWSAKLGRDNALVGRVLDVRRDRLIEWSELEAAFAVAVETTHPLILLGEVHDNADHHVLRGRLLSFQVCFNAVPGAAVLEHIRADQQGALDGWQALADRTAAGLMRALDWPSSGWPKADMFEPLFAGAIHARLALFAGEPARGQVRAVARGGIAVLATTEIERLRLDEPLPAPLDAALAAELGGSHCGMLPASAIGGMSAAQRYRDAHMAAAMVAAMERRGSAILLAGNGHVRTDRGVPWHLRRMAPLKRTAVSAAGRGRGRARTMPHDYLPRDPSGQPAADYIVFTPRVDRADPCEAMRKPRPKQTP